MTFKQFIRTITFWEILKGLWLTLISMAPSKNVTRQYPEEPRPAMAGFRGLHALVRDEITGREKCIACGLCAAICPSKCITIHTGEDTTGRKVALEYEVDVLRCVFCGFCVEACPVGAVVLSEHYEYSGYTREEFIYDKEMLLKNWDRFFPGRKGYEYLRNHWHPKKRNFEAYEGQPVGRLYKAPAAPAAPAKEDA